MPNFIPRNYRQAIMVTLNFEDQLQPGTFEYALHYFIENKLDLSIGCATLVRALAGFRYYMGLSSGLITPRPPRFSTWV